MLNLNCYKVAIHQPGYHRDIYYYMKILKSDVFIEFDSAQFVRRELQSRREFVVDGQRKWLSVPVISGRPLIKDALIQDSNVLKKHWSTIYSVYHRWPFWDFTAEELYDIYSRDWLRLIDLCDAIDALARRLLNIQTPVIHSSDIEQDYNPELPVGKRLAQLCRRVCPLDMMHEIEYLVTSNYIRSDHYLNLCRDGHVPAMDLREANVIPTVFRMKEPFYKQYHISPGYEKWLSIFDLIFAMGPDAGSQLHQFGEDIK